MPRLEGKDNTGTRLALGLLALLAIGGAVYYGAGRQQRSREIIDTTALRPPGPIRPQAGPTPPQDAPGLAPGDHGEVGGSAARSEQNPPSGNGVPGNTAPDGNTPGIPAPDGGSAGVAPPSAMTGPGEGAAGSAGSPGGAPLNGQAAGTPGSGNSGAAWPPAPPGPEQAAPPGSGASQNGQGTAGSAEQGKAGY